MDAFTPTELARLADYFAQELNPEDVVLFERWINEHPKRKRLVQDLQRTRRIEGVDFTPDTLGLAQQVELLFQDFAEIRSRDRISEMPMHPSSVRKAGFPPRQRLKERVFARTLWYGAGALVASALLVAMGWYVGGRSHTPVVAMSTYTTGNGEQATVTLPDGSTVLMNVASRIAVPTNYAAGNRTVRLSGEALFTVAHNDKAPFTVLAGHSTTRVLGTSFVVRHYAIDTTTTVAVRDGKVAVGSTPVAAAQQLSVGTRGTGTVKPVDPGVFGFATGVLTLKRMSLADAVSELDRWYDVDIRFADSTLGQERIEGQFIRGSVAELSELLDGMFGFRVIRDGRVLTLYRK
jgi:ferric-dicitrate binding protein FerR (iron transport regulator)